MVSEIHRSVEIRSASIDRANILKPVDASPSVKLVESNEKGRFSGPSFIRPTELLHLSIISRRRYYLPNLWCLLNMSLSPVDIVCDGNV
jgi:hypothetical protein